jgi:exonuclease III
MAHQTHNIIQWNCRGLRLNLPDLQILIQNHSPAIISLQETHITDPTYFPLRAFTHLSHLATTPNNYPKGGVSLLIHKTIPHTPINLITTLPAVAAQITLHTTISVCAIYLSPTSSWTYTDLLSIINQLPPPLILTGDFNAHHTLWGNTRNDQKGIQIEHLLTNTNLCLLNDKTPTYLHPTSGSTSSIDLSLISPSIFQNYSFTVISDAHGSDHHPILLRTHTPNTHHLPTRWSLKKADWAAFRAHCTVEIIPRYTTILTATDPIQELANTITDIAQETIPRTCTLHKNPPKPWYNDECKKAIRLRKQALLKLRYAPTPVNIEQYKIAKAKARRVIRQNQRTTWSKYVSQLNPRTPSKKVWDMIRKISGKRTPSPTYHIIDNNILHTDPTSTANCLAHAFSHNSSTANYTTDFQNHKASAEKAHIDFYSDNTEPYNQPFTLQELTAALQASHESSPGPDNIPYSLIKNLPNDILQLLLQIYNTLWSEDRFPTMWRQAIIIPIAKPGKDPSNPNHYRPISLTNCLCKIMERLINSRLVWYLELNNILTPYQAGFRKHRSTTDHLLLLDTFIRNAFKNKNHVLAVFFDLEKAYDMAWKFGSLTDLHDAGLRGHLPTFIGNFLDQRTFQVRLGPHLSNPQSQENGFPQGAILSVTIFALRINKIIKTLTPQVHPCLFVDDFTIYSMAPTVMAAQHNIQSTLDALHVWCTTTGFKFSPSKSQAILFHRPRSKPPPPTLTLNNVPIPVTKNIKYLGLTFDSNLNYRSHINTLKTKCLKTLNLLKVLSNTHWGGHQQQLLLTYRALIHSKMDYASFI